MQPTSRYFPPALQASPSHSEILKLKQMMADRERLLEARAVITRLLDCVSDDIAKLQKKSEIKVSDR